MEGADVEYYPTAEELAAADEASLVEGVSDRLSVVFSSPSSEIPSKKAHENGCDTSAQMICSNWTKGKRWQTQLSSV